MDNVNEDFDRLNAASQQYAPHHEHHGPSAGTIMAVGTLAWLGARAYRHHAEIEQGTTPRGWKWNVWGWYVALAGLIHFVIWLAWWANAFADNPFGVFFWSVGAAIWLPTWLLVYLHQGAIKRHNSAVLALRKAAE
jgi:uncharacterized membrane protein YoaK (UPF0700 family)